MKNSKQFLLVATAIILMACMSALAATDNGHPSSKAAVAVSKIALIESTTSNGWTTILSNTIKTASKKDLFIDVSLECGLYTDTKVDSLGGISDRAEAEAAVQVRVLVDGKEALPGVINFARRSQILIGEFQGLLTDEDGNVCLNIDADDPNLPITINEDCLRPETLELILDTMTANSFNFLVANVDTGVKTIEVQAKIDTFTKSTLDSGAKVKDNDIDGNDLLTGDSILTVDRANKFEVGQNIFIDDEEFVVEAIASDGKTLTLDHSAEVDHNERTRIYIVAGAQANATIGKGTVTVEELRLVKNGEIIIE